MEEASPLRSWTTGRGGARGCCSTPVKHARRGGNVVAADEDETRHTDARQWLGPVSLYDRVSFSHLWHLSPPGPPGGRGAACGTATRPSRHGDLVLSWVLFFSHWRCYAGLSHHARTRTAWKTRRQLPWECRNARACGSVAKVNIGTCVVMRGKGGGQGRTYRTILGREVTWACEGRGPASEPSLLCEHSVSGTDMYGSREGAALFVPRCRAEVPVRTVRTVR